MQLNHEDHRCAHINANKGHTDPQTDSHKDKISQKCNDGHKDHSMTLKNMKTCFDEGARPTPEQIPSSVMQTK